MTGLAEHAAILLGGVLRHAEPLDGGDLSQVFRCTLQDGRFAIVKNGPAPRAEAAMLGLFDRPEPAFTDGTARAHPATTTAGRSISLGRPWCMCGPSARAIAAWSSGF